MAQSTIKVEIKRQSSPDSAPKTELILAILVIACTIGRLIHQSPFSRNH